MQHTEADPTTARRINGAIIVGGRTFVAGDEEALAADPLFSTLDLDRLKGAGAIEGEWTMSERPDDDAVVETDDDEDEDDVEDGDEPGTEPGTEPGDEPGTQPIDSAAKPKPPTPTPTPKPTPPTPTPTPKPPPTPVPTARAPRRR
jgi:outer membrane biosynthesis protein TonB